MKYVKSPLNYTGNKFRLLDQIFDIIPSECDVFVDLFCGGGSIGLNYKKAKHVYLIDSNKYVLALLEHIANQDFDKFILRLEKLINKYHLTFTGKYGYEIYKEKKVPDNNGYKDLNEKGYYKMRADFNSKTNKLSSDELDLLYLLMVYSFNNDLRFNSKGLYNMPCGKTDLNRQNIYKIKSLIDQNKKTKINYLCLDFRSLECRKILFSADIIYADPPYLNTTAIYNENSRWTIEEETSLLILLKDLIKKGKNIYLSNIIKDTPFGENNSILCNWIKDNNFEYKQLDYNYHSSSYNKKNRYAYAEEVIIKGIASAN